MGQIRSGQVTSYAGPACPRCGNAVDPARMRAGPQRCSACGRDYEATPFAPPVTVVSVAAASDGSTPCARHAGNAAVASCQRCGVFLCALCRIEADSLVVCPACFERLSAQGALSSGRTRFVDYSLVAAWSAALGLVLFPAGLLAGPAALGCAIYGFRQAETQGDAGTRRRLWLAVAISVVVTVLGGGFAFALLRGR